MTKNDGLQQMTPPPTSNGTNLQVGESCEKAIPAVCISAYLDRKKVQNRSKTEAKGVISLLSDQKLPLNGIRHDFRISRGIAIQSTFRKH